MAYSTDNPPALVYCTPNYRHWIYQSEDAASVVRVDGYITNAEELGMQKGDQLTMIDTDSDPQAAHIMTVNAINANGSADLTDGTAIDETDTD